MIQNININSKRKIYSKLHYNNYFDYRLSDNNHYYQSNVNNFENNNVMTFECPFIVDGKRIFSNKIWRKSINNGLELNNIGFTGVDNGFITFDKRRISNKDFIELFTNSQFSIESGDTRFFMTKVNGNTQRFIFPTEIIENNNDCYINFNGGFYQGWFKIFGQEYQVAPSKIDREWVMSFVIRPNCEQNILPRTINELHPENKGIFFYIGTRAENKMWLYYKKDDDFFNKTIKDPNHVDENNPKDEYYSKENPNFSLSGYVEDDYVNSKECNMDYFQDDYFYQSDCGDRDGAFDSDYMEKDITINEEELADTIEDSNGHIINEKGYYDIKTDNKFITFNRTSTGMTVDNYSEDGIIIRGQKISNNINLFTLLDRTSTGKTINDIEEILIDHEKPYDIMKDIKNNAFALRVTDDGKIGYRYGILDCSSENYHYSMIEEYSAPNIIKCNEWNTVVVKISKIIPNNNECLENNSPIRIMIYVNGFLKFISKELPPFNFKELDDVPEKQEGVPYNISLGGGTLGLLETIGFDYYKVSNNLLPIERDFCGSFIGDIKSFKFYEDFADYSLIKDYLSKNKDIK